MTSDRDRSMPVRVRMVHARAVLVQRERRKARRTTRARLKDMCDVLERDFHASQRDQGGARRAQKGEQFVPQQSKSSLLRELMARCRNRRRHAALLAELKRVLEQELGDSGAHDGRREAPFDWSGAFSSGHQRGAQTYAWYSTDSVREEPFETIVPQMPPGSLWFSGQRHGHELSVLGFTPPLHLTRRAIKHAFLQMAQIWHPDKHPPEQQASAASRFKDARVAYEALTSVFPSTV